MHCAAGSITDSNIMTEHLQKIEGKVWRSALKDFLIDQNFRFWTFEN